MTPQLPPPDPHESLQMGPARDARLPEPMAVFMGGQLAPDQERVSDAILDLRPGLLIVCAAA